MLVDVDGAELGCICMVGGVPARFQVDTGSTFTQIAPALAPARVSRFGLGSAVCLGRRLWFPTCEVQIVPVGVGGAAIGSLGTGDLAPADTCDGAVTRVQIGALNLLGLNELRRWRVQLAFEPEASCSVDLSVFATWAPRQRCPHQQKERHDVTTVDDSTLSLQEALRAAEALTRGEVAAEDARSEQYPHLVDASKVTAALLALKVCDASCWPPAHARASLQPSPETSALTISLPALRRPLPAPRLPVLFGTADALVSDTFPPPRLPWP